MHTLSALALGLLSASQLARGLPTKREVPQEHSHQSIITSVQTSLQLNNPNGIVDSVFGLLGNAAAAGGAGNTTDLDCLQQATADQAFTNAKAAGNVQGMVDALIYRALERNTGAVGLASNSCTTLTAVNPEIAAISQHQDPASPNAASTNKAIVLVLAQQIASVGGNPQDALKSGTFAPGQIGDPTAKGNTCDDANDPNGCIFTQNLLVDDATAAEIDAAVAGTSNSNNTSTVSTGGSASNSTTGTGNDGTCNPVGVDVTVTSTAAATAISNSTVASATSISTVSTGSSSSGTSANLQTFTGARNTGASSSAAVVAASTTQAVAAATATAISTVASGTNLQTFTGALGGIAPPPVVAGGKGFVTDNSDFVNLAAALGRSCDVQHNACADQANSQHQTPFSVSDCDQQDTQCKAAGSA
ncbi:hypothetical protein DACRYDRAFT_60198 [Dacryopinax primogenitus]|uniref:Cell wall protein n=1 Tax=Dacryopinax primogenitus (strain DJM 731) TaxID=1858805 RepID=M5FPY0_DACPD|nr:uncharacterized protein DACRYDRAFT_60198 [Dacryopinax primogenitus]EJT96629.1 hypothetical protein DACRYDRAFT_60198 [Dacryopinax primogenitus]